MTQELTTLIESKDIEFREQLTALLNRHSKENGSDTPDFALANFLLGCLGAFDESVRIREDWYGRGPRPIEAVTAV